MKKIFSLIPFLSLLFSFSLSTAQETNGRKLFTSMPSSVTGVTFKNIILEDTNLFYYAYEYIYNGGGVAIGDINNDGLEDIYFSSTVSYNKLYLNLGDFKFKDITSEAGVDGGIGMKTGVNMIDINNDGFLDIFISKSGPLTPEYRRKMLYINNGNSTFTDKTIEYGLNDVSHTSQTYFLDYDKDGDMDLFFVNHPVDFDKAMLIDVKVVNGKMVAVPDSAEKGVSHQLFRNDKGRFTDVSRGSGVDLTSFGLSAVINDFNNDQWPDIYVANDFNKPDFLFINNHNGTFTNKLSDYFDRVSFSSMGSDMNDFNNDGLEDLLIVDMATEDPIRQKQLFTFNLNYDKFDLMIQYNLYYQYPHNTLQLNNGNNTFSEISFYSDVAETDWSWAPLIADFDNDGKKDVYITNGYYRDVTDWDYKVYVLDSIKNLMAKGIKVNVPQWFSQIPQVKIRNYFYHNNGQLRFDKYSDIWSDEPPSFSNGAAYGDLDNDGDLDLVVNNLDDAAFILKNNLNEISPQHYISFKIYKDMDSKQEIYGTVVRLFDEKGNIQMQRFDPQRGFLSTVGHSLHFGLGNAINIPRCEVIFPSGKQIVLENLKADQFLSLYESGATAGVLPENKQAPLFSDITSQNKFKYTHKENNYIDFKREPLIPYKCSRKGPYFSKADVNGDGREDIFVGGAAGSSGKLMIQNADGSFVTKDQPCFTIDKNFEDNGVLFFDADGDKDPDLYVVSGGAEFVAGNELYQDRLYMNDGKGNFSKSLNKLPKETSNGSCVISFDYDGDGDLDLFVGGGVLPAKFPNHDKSFIFRNNKGMFKDVTDSLAPDLKNSGIINYATWADEDGDGKNELLIAGEWMPLMILKVKDGKFVNADSKLAVKNQKGVVQNISLSQLTGWWSCIRVADIDKDGDADILLGNRGLNSKILADINEPCTVYGKDFDNNKSYDAVLGFYIKDKCYPMYHRDQLIDQMPFMRKKFIRYRMYAGKSLDEIFNDDQKKGMQIFKTNYFSSGVLINDGNESFHFENFPENAQLSNINDMIVGDFDKDGNNDVLIGGNSNDADVSTGNYDCNSILLLKGNGKGQFVAAPKSIFNVNVRGEVRKLIPVNDNKSFILLKNNATAQMLTIN